MDSLAMQNKLGSWLIMENFANLIILFAKGQFTQSHVVPNF